MQSLTARLACIRHAASVHPEPGSNSPKKCLILLYKTNLSFMKKLRKTDVDLHYSIFNELLFFRQLHTVLLKDLKQ